MLRVVNVRGFTPEQRKGVVYVGREFAGWPGHPLANPFGASRFAGEDGRQDCLDRYRAWLVARPTLEADLAALWEECRHGEFPLGCWCAPKSCHADILAGLLADRYGPKAGG